MSKTILKELTPLTIGDCFTIFERTKTRFDFPLHYHEEMELNFILNAKGAKRTIGNHIAEIEDIELVLVGPNLPHVWKTYKCKSKNILEITIQFHKDLFEEKLLRRNQLHFIRELFEKSKRGVLFSPLTAASISSRIKLLSSKTGFDSVLEFLSILHDLSVSRNMILLTDIHTGANTVKTYNSRRIEKVTEYLNLNFDKPVPLSEAAKLANMTEVSFSRFFKAQTGTSYIDCLLEIRLENASRLLIDTHESVSKIAFNCGFNNISNFNRLFKKKKGTTPKEFRDSNTSENRIFI